MSLLEVPLQVGKLRAADEKLHDCRLAGANIALEAKLTLERFEFPLCLGGHMEAGLANGGLRHPEKMPRSSGFSALRFFGLSVGCEPTFREESYSTARNCTENQQVRPRKKTVVPQHRQTIAYVRVSCDEQAVEGVSLAAQEARIAMYCAAMGWTVSDVVCDAGESAKTLQRAGMAALLAEVRAGAVARVVTLKLDRVTRSTRDLADLLDLFAKCDTALVSVSEHLDTSSASGRLVVNMLGVVAQWEREAIAERTAFALAHKRKERSVYGRTPFGFVRVGDALVPDPREQAALEEAVRMDRAGASFREIAARLTETGVTPHRGKAWHASSVRAMLRSKMAMEATA
jgi:site-specific DNA recombinase